jgi:hypothetical protein
MRIKISAGAERDIADGCDFYHDIDPNLAICFHDSISADIDFLLLYAGIHANIDGWHYPDSPVSPSFLALSSLLASRAGRSASHSHASLRFATDA